MHQAYSLVPTQSGGDSNVAADLPFLGGAKGWFHRGNPVHRRHDESGRPSSRRVTVQDVTTERVRSSLRWPLLLPPGRCGCCPLSPGHNGADSGVKRVPRSTCQGMTACCGQVRYLILRPLPGYCLIPGNFQPNAGTALMGRHGTGIPGMLVACRHSGQVGAVLDVERQAFRPLRVLGRGDRRRARGHSCAFPVLVSHGFTLR